MKAVDWMALLGYISGSGLTSVFMWLATPPGPAKWLAAGPMVAGIAGAIRVAFNKTGAPATSLTQSATIVADGTAVVHRNTPAVATNALLPITEPQTPHDGP